jgi:UDP-N-acetylglucosamine 1-carboxyvinyltransferase
MEKLKIHGEKRLQGEVGISGAKNSALPILAATILSVNHPVVINNVPHLSDVTTMLALLAKMGARTTLCESSALEVDTQGLTDVTAPYDLVKKMRASILVLGPLLGRFGRARVSLPGGCAIGSRPVDMHLQAMKAMGAELSLVDGYIEAKVAGKLQGSDIYFDKVSVTGTENVMMAAVLAEGRTRIFNAAREPEIKDLSDFLIGMGAKIVGAGFDTIVIEGVNNLCQQAPFSIMPDRIEAGTYLAAAVVTQGDITLHGVRPNTMEAVLTLLRQTGASLTVSDSIIRCQMLGRPKSISLTTEVYPGFPTDMQAQMLTINAIAKGSGSVTETIFENRFMHVQELVRMGANIKLHGNTATIQGVDQLRGAPVMATDLRASASLILAGLVASGETVIDRIYHICRGYERIEEKLQSLGAMISRVT